jgi:hypothetical protein
MNWLDAEIVPPNERDVLLVIDSWNIYENNIEAHKKDEGADNQTILSYRTVYWDEDRDQWWCDSEQRVRFKWYIVLTIPEALKKVGFEYIKFWGIHRDKSWLYAPGSAKYKDSQQKIDKLSQSEIN